MKKVKRFLDQFSTLSTKLRRKIFKRLVKYKWFRSIAKFYLRKIKPSLAAKKPWVSQKILKRIGLGLAALLIAATFVFAGLYVKDRQEINSTRTLSETVMTLESIVDIEPVNRPNPNDEVRALLKDLKIVKENCQGLSQELQSEDSDITAACKQVTLLVDYQISLYTALINYMQLEGDESYEEIRATLDVTLQDFENIRASSEIGDPALSEQISRLKENRELIGQITPHELRVYINKNQANTLNDRINYWVNLVHTENLQRFFEFKCLGIQNQVTMSFITNCHND